ncbi:membrane protein [Adhaeribacter aerolatus]|uniref:Membrane protein n=1 Tax=Adhaeribacter aerolatus TaxID=670289 RepID=A0A512AVK4_9BACT|nr:heparan-alpha-glucosaminide N-acetyltransferase domain-containing protein [Adhaeribacter aerolatus]GEO03587.1 membrane protein [Adhaeribacter aerolatus]
MNKLYTAPAVLNNPTQTGNKLQRYLSLDVMRGLTIALMIVVNTPGSWESVYAPLRHAQWHGFTVTDLVFPTFLFVVGNALSFSMRKFEGQNSKFLKKVFKRTALIFLIGLFLNAFPFVTRVNGELTLIDFSSIRLFGVLQRIALCYGVAALVIHYFQARGALIFSVLALFGYWAIMYFFGNQPDPYTLAGNAALKLDSWLLSEKNLYKGYGIPFDPEGLLSTLPAVVNVIAGYFAGRFIQLSGNNKNTLMRLAMAGVILTTIGLVWNIFFPINKPIWTSSYVVYTVGLDLLILATIMLLIEVAHFRSWTHFFEAFGKNPLFIYALSGALIETLGLIRVDGKSLNGWLYQNLYASWLTGENASLLFAISYMLLLWVVAYLLDKKKIYLKI